MSKWYDSRQELSQAGAMTSKHIKAILSGFGQVLVLDPGRGYARPSRNAYEQDMAKLRLDAKAVGSDMRYVLTREH